MSIGRPVGPALGHGHEAVSGTSELALIDETETLDSARMIASKSDLDMREKEHADLLVGAAGFEPATSAL